MDLSRRTIFTSAVGATGAASLISLATASPASATVDPAFDAQVNELLGSSTQTRAALDARYVQISHRPVNLADRLPAGATSSTDATAILTAALAESPQVEWPHATALRLTGTVTIPEGGTVVGHAGAVARIDHGGAGFEVAGALAGVTVQRVTGSSALGAVGVWIAPGSSGARVEDLDITGDHSTGVAVGGAPETRAGTATDALVQRVRVEKSQIASPYNFRLDDSRGVTLAHCIGLGCALDNIKARVHARDFRVIGGRFTGSVGGDGFDGFAGGEGGYIGGGVIFEDNGQNGLVIKTDDIAPLSLADQFTQYGMPRQVIIDGVIIRRSGGSGLALHRSDAADSDYAPPRNVRLPWLADVAVSSVVIEDVAAHGVFVNGYNYVIDNVQVIRPRGHGVHVHANGRQHRFSKVAVRAAGFQSGGSGTYDGFRLEGKHLWLSQCAAYGGIGEFVDDSDIAAATKHSRYGFISLAGTGSTHHFAQCWSYGHRVAPIAGDAIGQAKHTDCDYENYVSGLSLGGMWLRNNSGTLEKSTTGGTAGFSPV